MDKTLARRFDALKQTIGNTPLLAISFEYKGERRLIYAKAEYFNLTGSIKDRVALHVLEDAYERGLIQPGDIICEATSGNMGISYAAVGANLGHKVVIYMPDWMSKERVSLMEAYGAEVRLVSREQGGFLGSIELSRSFAEGGGVFLPCQFSNPENANAHYLTTGVEIGDALAARGLRADGVVAGVGTGGTIMGLSRRLREYNPALSAFPLEPENSPTLSTGFKVGAHRIQGISDEFIPDLLKLSELSGVVSVDDGDAINMSRMLAAQLGLGVGVSSGANFLGAVLAQERLGGGTLVTVFPDDNKKYLSTDYSCEQKPLEGFITPDIKLLSLEQV